MNRLSINQNVGSTDLQEFLAAGKHRLINQSIKCNALQILVQTRLWELWDFGHKPFT